MPILDIEVVDLTGDVSAISQKLADHAGEVFDSSRGRTWIKLRNLESTHYAENDEPSAPLPVFVRVLEARPPEDSELRRLMKKLTAAIADVLDRSEEHVHILLEPPALGRISFGGKLRE
jgi:phenylpyruvate tautomerase PptA (4-oxalocrotonate tautomerase family)